MKSFLKEFFQAFILRFCVICMIVFVAPGAQKICNAAEIQAGIGAVEEGDDRGRGALIVSGALTNNWWSKAYLWGRSYGPVTETSGIISMGKRFDLFGSKSLRSTVGFTSLAEHTAIKYKDAPTESSAYTSTNFGLTLGVQYDFIKIKNLTIIGSWDSHLFAAGEAILLLVTGRKQIIGLTAGMSL